MENINIKKQIQYLLKGQAIELVPVRKEHIDFICAIETDIELWHYEEYVETDKERIRKNLPIELKKIMFLTLLLDGFQMVCR